jgi:hypothetical protein
MTDLTKWCESQENLAKFWNQWEFREELREDDCIALYIASTSVYAGYKRYKDVWYENPMKRTLLDFLFILLNMKCPGWELTDLEDGRFCLDTNKDSRMEYARTFREAVVAALKGDLE